MIACQDDSIAKAQTVDPKGELWFVPFAFKGKACYKVYWGDYSSAADAQAALAGLPETFRSGKPQVVSLGAALKNASP
jgi:septal ring-binding cell division protein DamX